MIYIVLLFVLFLIGNSICFSLEWYRWPELSREELR